MPMATSSSRIMIASCAGTYTAGYRTALPGLQTSVQQVCKYAEQRQRSLCYSHAQARARASSMVQYTVYPYAVSAARHSRVQKQPATRLRKAHAALLLRVKAHTGCEAARR